MAHEQCELYIGTEQYLDAACHHLFNVQHGAEVTLCIHIPQNLSLNSRPGRYINHRYRVNAT